jgi:hypothetical protein
MKTGHCAHHVADPWPPGKQSTPGVERDRVGGPVVAGCVDDGDLALYQRRDETERHGTDLPYRRDLRFARLERSLQRSLIRALDEEPPVQWWRPQIVGMEVQLQFPVYQRDRV